MRKIIISIFITLLVISCSSHKKLAISDNSGQLSVYNTVYDGDGSSYQKAIVITEKTETTGIQAEYSWIKEHYPDYKVISQSLQYHNKKPYDIINIVTSKGESKAIYFDISSFYGKF